MANPVTAVRNYFQQSAAELKKVAWPSRDMTIRYSVLVVAVSVAMAVFFAGLDFGLQTLVNTGLNARANAIESAPVTPVVPDLEETGDTGVDVQSEPITIPASTPGNDGNITLPPIETSNP